MFISSNKRIPLILMLVLFMHAFSFSQALRVTDTSETHAKRIMHALNSNKEIVKYIEYSLVQRGLPKHLRNLSLLESDFNKSSISSAGAVGIWQFMPSHANEHGLTSVDRADVYRSTQTAMNSLSRLYKKYNNWITVLAAYNCGEGNVAKAMSLANSSYYEDFYVYLPQETIYSISKYLNACNVTGELEEVLNNYRANVLKNNFNLKGIQKENPFKKGVIDFQNSELLKTVINSGYDLKVISTYTNLSLEEIFKMNPNIEQQLVEKSEIEIYLPADSMSIFEMYRNEILRTSLLGGFSE